MADKLRQYGWSSKYEIALPNGVNSRLDEVQAAALMHRLNSLDSCNDRRRSILSCYANAAPEGVRMVQCARGTVAHLAVAITELRDALREHMRTRDVATDIHYPILDCDQPGWHDSPSRTVGDLVASRRSVPRLVSLPCFPGMTDPEVERVCDALQSFAA